MGELLSLGVMGIRGSFSEEAALEYARDNNLGEVEIVELLNTEKVLRAVEAGEVDIGIFALENSNGGVVYESVYAMAAHRFRVVDLFEIDVNHTLLVHPSLPGRESIERASAAVKSLADAKSPTEFFQLQSEIAKSNFDRMVASFSQLTEASVKLAGEAIQPLSNRAALNAEKINELTA